MGAKVCVHRRNRIDYFRAYVASSIQHARPQVDSDCVVAASWAIGAPATDRLPGCRIKTIAGKILHPVHGISMAGALLEHARNVARDLPPWAGWVHCGQTLE